jgi:hypothetical protein
MSKFDKLNDNLMTVLNECFKSQELAKLLIYNTEDALFQPDLEDTSVILFQKLFPYPFVPGTQEAACSVINIIFDDFELSNTKIKNGVISFKVLCHTSLWKMIGALRPFSIISEIDKLFNEQKVACMGKLSYLNTKLLWATNDYDGYSQNYKIFNSN